MWAERRKDCGYKLGRRPILCLVPIMMADCGDKNAMLAAERFFPFTVGGTLVVSRVLMDK